VPVTSEAIKYKAWKRAKLQAMQHHSHQYRLVCTFGGGRPGSVSSEELCCARNESLQYFW